MTKEENIPTKTKRRWGDRKDGRRIKDLDGIHFIMPYLFPNRCDSEVYILEKMDVTELLKYLERKNGADAAHKTTPFHVFVTAIGKTIYHRPLLNRFIAGRRIYERNKITLSFVVRRKLNEESEEMLLVMPVTGDTTLKEVSRKIIGEAGEIRKGASNDIGDTLNFLTHMPRFLMRFIMLIFRMLDFYGKMPKSLTEGDTNYSTALLSNLGSIKCDAPYHHLNNYGNNSVVITIGEIHKEQIYNQEGLPEVRDVVNFGIVLDERIADGFYFAKSVKLLRHIIANPEMLERPIKEEVEYEY